MTNPGLFKFGQGSTEAHSSANSTWASSTLGNFGCPFFCWTTWASSTQLAQIVDFVCLIVLLCVVCVCCAVCLKKSCVCVCSVSAVCVSAVCPLCVCCVDVVAPVEPVFHGDQSSHSVASPLPPHLTGLREEVAVLRSLVNTLVARPPPPPTHSAVQVNPGPLPEVPPWRVRQTGRQPRVCRREICSPPVPNRCRVRFCQDHCTSPRCNVHARQTRSQERHFRF